MIRVTVGPVGAVRPTRRKRAEPEPEPEPTGIPTPVSTPSGPAENGDSYCGPYFRPVRDVMPPSRPRGTSFAAPIRVL